MDNLKKAQIWYFKSVDKLILGHYDFIKMAAIKAGIGMNEFRESLQRLTTQEINQLKAQPWSSVD